LVVIREIGSCFCDNVIVVLLKLVAIATHLLVCFSTAYLPTKAIIYQLLLTLSTQTERVTLLTLSTQAERGILLTLSTQTERVTLLTLYTCYLRPLPSTLFPHVQ